MTFGPDGALFAADTQAATIYAFDLGDADEMRWSFTPRDPWQPGEYELVALSVLEDRAGNRIGRPFEVAAFERPNGSPDPETFVVPFRIAWERRGK